MNVYIATWFYSSPPGEKIDYPGVGINSDGWDFQSIYWNCIYSFFFSADKCCIPKENIEYKFLLFINGEVPDANLYGNAFNPHDFMVQKNVKIIKFSPEHVPQSQKLKQFRSQFVLIDILSRAQQEIGYDDVLIVLDSDCFFINPIPLNSLLELKTKGLQSYRHDWPDEYVANGLSCIEFNRIVEKLAPQSNCSINYWCGGEYFGFNYDVLKRFNLIAGDLFSRNFELDKPLITEEHLFTMIFLLLSEGKESLANSFIRRIWTGKNYNNVSSSDEQLSIVHLPAEKVDGFKKFAHDNILSNSLKSVKTDYNAVKSYFNLA
jgi:hypothetical protein